MLGRMLLTWRTLGRTFGAWIAPLFTGLVVLSLRIVVAVGMALDPLLFPSLRRARVDRPIVIVGNPRSGTTFLHRFLDKQGVAVGCHLWEMLVPSLTLQFLVRPFLPLLEKVSPARHHPAAVHKTSMTAAETDDAGMFFHFFDGFFLYGFFLAFAREDLLDRFDPRKRDTSPRDFAYLESVWRRILVARKGSRVTGKLFSLGPR
ncbi:MAG: sulfotransferase, partial [Deltaproteobacteria bacterium]|nr:sulfotransferase [Deltaproteobacteria bacterium]